MFLAHSQRNVFLVLIATLYFSNGLSGVNVSYVEEASLNSCVVVVGTRNSSLSLLQELVKVFEDEKAVNITILSDEEEYKDRDSFIVVYPKREIDRTCLLSPRPPAKGKPYKGPSTLRPLVQFINENCGTYRSPSGTLTPLGLIRDQIMQNFFRPQQNTGICKRVKSLTKSDFFWEYLSRSQPVVIEGGAKNWKAMSKWTSEYLREMYADKRVHIKLTERGEFEGVESAFLWPGYSEDWIPQTVREKLPFPDLVVVRPATAEMKFSEFIDLISGGINYTSGLSAYLEYSSIPYYMPELEKDIEELFPDFLNRRHLNMWLSDGNTLGKLHFDPYDNFLCQISGEKDLVLFEPHSNENMYEAHIPEAILGYSKKRRQFYRRSLLESTSMVMSPVDILRPDLERFPKFRKARRIECTLRPGDILFMPSFWWHEVQSYPDTKQHRNLAVNFWYEPLLTKEFPCAKCKMTLNPYYHELLYNFLLL